jgi:hypothetical protein
MLARDNVHGPLSVAALVCVRRGHRTFSMYFAKCKVVKKNLAICKVLCECYQSLAVKVGARLFFLFVDGAFGIGEDFVGD